MTATALHLVPTPAPATVAVHPLVAACTGTPMLLTDADVDLIAFANAIPDVIGDTDPDNCFPAQMVLHWYVNHVMEQRRCKGTRAEDLASAASHVALPAA